uniref:Major sperm protein n=1 Tax=Panagrellus redivivus TaxID=6233 RepID=A0A7E4WC96_PANRE
MDNNRIVFVPSEMVSFKSLTQKQIVQLSIRNNWDRNIIFKMKTTRPQLFKMRPVFGMVDKGQEKTIRLIFKGFGSKEKPPCSRDRFTIVVAPAPADCIDPSRTWRQQKCPEVLTQTARKVLRIQYGEEDHSKVVSVIQKPVPPTASTPAATSTTSNVSSAPSTSTAPVSAPQKPEDSGAGSKDPAKAKPSKDKEKEKEKDKKDTKKTEEESSDSSDDSDDD